MGEQGFQLSPQKVGQLLHVSGYSLQATNKTLEGASHPDRNEQFEFINERVDEFQARGAAVISVDAKSGNFVSYLETADADLQQAAHHMQPERVNSTWRSRGWRNGGRGYRPTCNL